MITRQQVYRLGYTAAKRDAQKDRNTAYHDELRFYRGQPVEMGAVAAFNSGHADALANKPSAF